MRQKHKCTQKFPGKHEELTRVLKINISFSSYFILNPCFWEMSNTDTIHFLIWLRKISHSQAYNWNSTYDDRVWSLWTLLRKRYVSFSITNGVILENTYLHKERLSNLPTTTKPNGNPPARTHVHIVLSEIQIVYVWSHVTTNELVSSCKLYWITVQTAVKHPLQESPSLYPWLMTETIKPPNWNKKGEKSTCNRRYMASKQNETSHILGIEVVEILTEQICTRLPNT